MTLSKYTLKALMILAVFVTAGLSACGVLHDDLSGCELRLRFRYNYNLSGEDWFAAQVDEVKVFVFDPSGGFLQVFTESGDELKSQNYGMRIPYELKGCTAVVWAGNTDRFYTLPTLVPGDRIERLTLEYRPDDGTSYARLDALWHSAPALLSFPDDGGTGQTMSLVRNTNDVTVGITRGDAPADVEDFEIEITGANGSYDHKNAIAGAGSITYRPCPPTSMQDRALLHTLRLVKGSDMRFCVRSASTGRAIDMGGQTSVDLIDYLLKSKPDAMADQEYLDRRYEWDIDIRLSDAVGEDAYLALSITINGWTYWFHPTDL